jgi:predicted outer membrane repeat protein
VLVTGSTFTTNSTSNSGAAAAITSATQLNIANSTFMTNTSTGNRAGALYLAGLGGLAISASTFTGSSAPIEGGAIYLDTVPAGATISGTTFDGSHTAGDGGAIWFGTVSSGSLTISTSTFTGNSADGLGGAIYADSVTGLGTILIDSSTFATNESGTFGTSIDVNALSGQFVFIQSTIDDADTGGGVYGLNFGTVDQGTSSPVIGVGLSTIVAPGAVRIAQGNSGPTLLLDNILSSSSADIALRLDDALPAYQVTMQYDIDSDVGTYPWILDQGGNQFSVADPMLATLALNGGPTMTRLPLAGSPAINLGDPAISFPPPTDQRGTGFARISGGRIDIGAVEVQAALAATGSELPWVPAGAAMLLLLSGAVALRFARLKASRQTA